MNYFMGLTSISVGKFLLGGCGVIPGMILYIIIGTSIPNIADAASGNYEDRWMTISIITFGILMLFATIFYIARITFKFLDKIVHITDLDEKQL